jgi:hypothetical protein
MFLTDANILNKLRPPENIKGGIPSSLTALVACFK